jgi:hypothetical protein
LRGFLYTFGGNMELMATFIAKFAFEKTNHGENGTK